MDRLSSKRTKNERQHDFLLSRRRIYDQEQPVCKGAYDQACKTYKTARLLFDYRLAPEFPYPAAVEDALSAWNYILSCGYDAKDIIVAGDSAGGNLALVLTLLLREQHAKLPKSLILFSPWTDMTSSGKSYHVKELVDPVLTNAYIQKAVSCYLSGTPTDSPYVSPLFADLSGFPPVYIQAGTNEILLDDSRGLYKQLLTHNIYAKLDLFEGMWHVFQMSPIAKAEEAMQKAALFIK